MDRLEAARRNAGANRGELQMQLSNESILVILFVGLVAGWLAGKIVRGTGFGIIGDILVGIAGALVASLLFPKLGIAIGTGLVREIIYSAIGAVILLLVVRLLRTRGRFLHRGGRPALPKFRFEKQWDRLERRPNFVRSMQSDVIRRARQSG